MYLLSFLWPQGKSNGLFLPFEFCHKRKKRSFLCVFGRFKVPHSNVGQGQHLNRDGPNKPGYKLNTHKFPSILNEVHCGQMGCLQFFFQFLILSFIDSRNVQKVWLCIPSLVDLCNNLTLKKNAFECDDFTLHLLLFTLKLSTINHPKGC